MRSGMTIIEVMIGFAILAVALLAMLGNISTLDLAHRSAKQTASVQQMVQIMVERFQGATWFSLGQTAQPWSWHRREDPAAFNPPLQDNAADPRHSLQAQGIIDGPSSLDQLAVYVEYYDMDLFQTIDPDNGTVVWNTNNGSQFRARRADATLRMAEDPTLINLTEVTDAIIIRVSATWRDVSGGARRHEITFARRK